MKKNLITVIILALVLANLILTAILVFTIIPQTKKSNQLIDQVCSAINLELQSGENTPATPEVPIDHRWIYRELKTGRRWQTALCCIFSQFIFEYKE